MKMKIFRNSFAAILIILLIGCQHSPEKEVLHKLNTIETRYYKNTDDVTVSKIKELDTIEVKKGESIDHLVTNGKAALMVQKVLNDGYVGTGDIYVYDFSNRQLKKAKSFKQKTWIVAFTEIDGHYIYACLDKPENLGTPYSLKIIDEDNGVTKVIAAAKVGNPSEFIPFFVVQGKTVYFMLSDLQSDDGKYDEKAVMKQSFIAYTNGESHILYHTESNIVNGEWNQADGMIQTNTLYYHSKGIMFQEFHKEKSYLYYWQNEKMNNYVLSDNELYLRGFLDGYAVIFDKKENKHKTLNLRTGEWYTIQTDQSLYTPEGFHDTVLYFLGGMLDKSWLLFLQKDGSTILKSFDGIYEKALGRKRKDVDTLCFSTDGEYILVNLLDYSIGNPHNDFFEVRMKENVK
ncbi:hypothetical protein MKC91_05370 [[Clostridium] innocuum]|nr:hypothetical protein [Erysipelotrichaceae bacterium]MCR0381126.1 hypothetical protein [[Clostridium] innocuum]MCR0412392.1 hypothetical protein [[Clostridium] innocuum]MCR0533740.1 hypothetical protein [[Clostridium] innocuum]MCR0537825.1 hypothetical protein [[Clostridium] innocuum]